MIVDTHCHLNHEQFSGDVDAAIERALLAGIERMIVVGFDLPSSEEAVTLAESHRALYAAVGIHPHDAISCDGRATERLRELAAHPRTVAIGEIGLDYHYDLSSVEAQKAALSAQLSLARETGLPVIFHCRDAYDDLLDHLELSGLPARGGVMHCWAGTAAQAHRSLGLGLYLGIGGVLTFKNADRLREAILHAPLDRIVVETDAPYLAPVPYRGKRNEPAYTALVARTLAQVRVEDYTAVTEATTNNAMRLFWPRAD